jgi:hypothetical protein
MHHGRIHRALVALLATASLVGAAPVAAPAAPPDPPRATATKSCGSGFRHAVIDRQHKCLRRGQFCRRSADSQYRRHGFRCIRYDARVDRYRLT